MKRESRPPSSKPRPGVRPTTRKVLEALVQRIEHAFGGVEGLHVLEVCAGTGQLGLALAERGATLVSFVERDPQVAQDLRARARSQRDSLPHKPRLEVLTGSAPACLERLQDTYQLVFVDPPYSTDVARGTLTRLAGSSLLGPGALVIVEHHHKDDVPLHVEPLSSTRQVRYGETAVTFYQWKREAETEREAESEHEAETPTLTPTPTPAGMAGKQAEP